MTAKKPNANVIHAAHSSGAWYTPEPLRRLAHAVLGGIDLDPCTHNANPLDAATFYTARRSAWRHDWAAELIAKLDAAPRPRSTVSLWMNPPYGRDVGQWLDAWHETIAKLSAERFVVRGLLLVPARTDTRWYQAASWEQSQATCELRSRVRFERREHGRVTRGESARWGCALIYYGPDRKRAAAQLRAVGNVRLAQPWEGPKQARWSRQTSIPFESAQLSLAK